MAYSNVFTEGLHKILYDGARVDVEKVTDKTVVVGIKSKDGKTVARLKKMSLDGDYGLLPIKQGGGYGLINHDAHERARIIDGKYAGTVLDAREFVR